MLVSHSGSYYEEYKRYKGVSAGVGVWGVCAQRVVVRSAGALRGAILRLCLRPAGSASAVSS